MSSLNLTNSSQPLLIPIPIPISTPISISSTIQRRKMHAHQAISLEIEKARGDDEAAEIDALHAFLAVVVVRRDGARVAAEVQVLRHQFAGFAEQAVREAD